MSAARWFIIAVGLSLGATAPSLAGEQQPGNADEQRRKEAKTADAQAADPDEALLRAAKVGTSDEALLQFVRDRVSAQEQTGTIDRLIRQLASESLEEREEASAKLTAMDLAARPALLKAMNDPDAEVKQRAKHCLARIEWQRRASVMLAVVRRVLTRHPAGTIEALLRYLPYAQDEEVEEEVYFSIDRLAASAGKLDRALVASLKDTAPARRALAACIAGRMGNPEQRAAVKKLLTDDDATVRLRAAQGLLAGKDKAAVPALISLLDQPSAALAWQAEELLRWVAGQESPAPTVGSATPVARRTCREAWEGWWRANGAQLDLAKEDPDQCRPGLLLVWRNVAPNKPGGQVWLYGCDGVPRCKLTGLPEPGEVYFLPEGHILTSTGRRVTERDLEGKVVWEWCEPNEFLLAFRRVSSGNTLLVSCNAGTLDPTWQVREVAPDSREALRSDHKIEGFIGQSWLMPGGRLFIERYKWLPEPIGIWELDLTFGAKTQKTKSVLKDILDGAQIRHIEPLRADHLLLAHDKGATEIDASGRTVWKSALPLKRGSVYATRLHNGDTLVHDRTVGVEGLFIQETRDGKLVWELLTDGQRARECLSLVRLGFEAPRSADWRVDSVASRMRQLRHKNPRIRARAVSELVRLGPQAADAIPALIEAFDDPAPEVSRDLSYALGGIGPKLMPHLVKALKDPRPRVRAGAAASLSSFRDDPDASVPLLINALRDDSWLVRSEAARSLEVYGPKTQAAVPALIKALKDENRQVAGFAASALCQTRPRAPDAVPALIEAAKLRPEGPDDALRLWALNALGTIGPGAKEAVPFLTEALKSKEFASKRHVVAFALGGIGSAAEPAVPTLLDMLKNERDLGDRRTAVCALGMVGTGAKAAIPALAAALKRETAALNSYDDDFREQVDDFREQVAVALGKMGPAAKEAVPALIEALKVDKRIESGRPAQVRERVRIAVAVSLGRLGRTPRLRSLR